MKNQNKDLKIGFDVVSIKDFYDKSDYFIKRFLTKNEYNDFLKIKTKNNQKKFLACYWCLKEAVYKIVSKQGYKKHFINIEFKKNNNEYECVTFKKIKTSVSYCESKVFALAIFLKNF